MSQNPESRTKLTQTQRTQVLVSWREGLSVSQIAKKSGLLREYVQAYVSFLNKHEDSHGLEAGVVQTS